MEIMYYVLRILVLLSIVYIYESNEDLFIVMDLSNKKKKIIDDAKASYT